MFAHRILIERIDAANGVIPCPIAWLDNFAMRNFTNDAIFDDTLPVGDGLLEIGRRVPLDRLQASMEEWFRRKGYLKAGDTLRVTVSATTPRNERRGSEKPHRHSEAAG